MPLALAALLGLGALAPASEKGPEAKGASAASATTESGSRAAKAPSAYRQWKDAEDQAESPKDGKARRVAVKAGMVNLDSGKCILVPLPQVRVQLDTAAPSFLETELAVEVSRASVQEELKLNEARIQEIIIQIFHTISPAALHTLEGKLVAKRRITQTINTLLASGVARNVYFTQFMIKEAPRPASEPPAESAAAVTGEK